MVYDYSIKHPLNERLSSRVYHFTSLYNAWYILSKNTMFLQGSLHGSGSDNYGGKYFYLSLTRNRSTTHSYGSNYKNRKSGCRIEFDGDLLNQRFKGFAMDYWGSAMGKMSYYTERKTGNSRIDPVQSSNEMEDRLVYDKSTIPNIKRYIKRIDLFALDEKTMKEASAVRRACPDLYSKVFIYDNIHEFDKQSDKTVDLDFDFNDRVDNKNPNIYDLLYAMGYFFTVALDINYDNIKQSYGTIAKWLKSYRLDDYMSRGLVHYVQKALNGWEDNTVKIDYLSNHLKSIEREGFDDGQTFMQIVGDFMKKHGYKSFSQWKIAVKRDMLKKLGKSNNNIDYNKKVDVYALVGINWSEGDGYIRKASAQPENDSFWEFMGYDSYDDRMGFLNEIYAEREPHYDYFKNEYVDAAYTHKSKTDEHFYKYLQHLARKNISIAEMLGVLDRLNIPLDSENIFGGYKIVRTKINYWEAPQNLIDEGFFDEN